LITYFYIFKMGFTDQEEETISGIVFFTNLISVIFLLLIWVAYILLKELRVFSYKLILYKTIADFIYCISFLVPSDQGEISCITAAFLKTHGCLSSILWSAIIAVCLFRTVFYEDNELERNQKLFLFIGFGVPIVTASIPFIFEAYGQAQGWCWIKLDSKDSDVYAIGVALRLALFFAPLWIIIPINLYIYARVINHLRNDIDYTDEMMEYRKNLILRLSSYPVILVISFLPISIKRFYEFSDTESDFVLSVIAALFVSLQGILDAIAYGMTDTVRVRLFSCCYKQSHSESGDAIYLTRRISSVSMGKRNTLNTSITV
jgi:hypothetical protein